MGNEKTIQGYLENCKKYKKHNYKELNPKELEYLHETDLKIFKAIKEVFERHNIQYCAVGGTLLGAFTRKTFIPWDEDIDISVFEEDYDRMIDLLMDELPDWMVVQCTKTDSNYYHEWIKVSDRYSVVYPNNGVYKNQGCWVDIYKLRKMPRKDVDLNIALDHKAYLQRRLAIGDLTPQDYNDRMSLNSVEERIAEGKVKSDNSDDLEMVYLIGTASKPFVEAKYVLPTKEYEFVDTTIKSFCDAEAYLRNHYGENFRVLPPDEYRNIAINKVEILQRNNLENHND